MSVPGVSLRPLWDPKHEREYSDHLIIERPVELWIQGQSHAVMMRTPGEDIELITGFLWSSGVIDERADLSQVKPCPRDPLGRVDVSLAAGVPYRAQARASYLSSSCGLCSLKGTEDISGPPAQRVAPLSCSPEVLFSQLSSLDQQMTRFQLTGGCHGAALLTPAGQLAVCFEDVGRHNAVDKVLGWALRSVDRLSPRGESAGWGLAGWALLVSSRAGFEIIHKASACGVSAVVSMGAGSSLAHDYARAVGLSLFSFARGDRANWHGGPSLK